MANCDRAVIRSATCILPDIFSNDALGYKSTLNDRLLDFRVMS